MEPLLSAEELSVGWWFLIPFAGALLALILTETGASTSWCRPGTATRARVAIAGVVGAVNVHWLAVELLAETAQSTSRTLSLVSGGAMGLAAINDELENGKYDAVARLSKGQISRSLEAVSVAFVFES